jgi:hypothetical protein
MSRASDRQLDREVDREVEVSVLGDVRPAWPRSSPLGRT